MKPGARPIYLNLLRIHLPLPGWVSILHRVSGALLFVVFPLGVWGLSASLSGETGFQRVAGWVVQPWTRLFLLLLIGAFIHHLLAGLRHLALDVHWGVERNRSRQTSLLVLLATGMITLWAAWSLFA